MGKSRQAVSFVSRVLLGIRPGRLRHYPSSARRKRHGFFNRKSRRPGIIGRISGRVFLADIDSRF
jgi:hypothetical protein